jgi:hypothetical protein
MAVEPKATVLMPAAPAPAGTVWSYGLYLNPHSTEDSAERMLSWGELEGLRLGEFDQVTYVPLTECAAREGGFQRLVAELVSDTFFHPKACLLIRLPPAGADLAARLRLALEGIRSSGVPLPQARSKNIVFLSDDVAEETLAPLGARLSFILHQNFEFWRYTPSLYALADKILVFLDHDWKRPTDTAKHLLREAFGQAPRFAFGARNPDGEWAGE